jgi:hypothetical protein
VPLFLNSFSTADNERLVPGSASTCGAHEPQVLRIVRLHSNIISPCSYESYDSTQLHTTWVLHDILSSHKFSPDCLHSPPTDPRVGLNSDLRGLDTLTWRLL